MAMRMPPEAAQQSFLPAVNRSSLVFFGGAALIVLNLYWVNGGQLINSVFVHNQGAEAPMVGVLDAGLQLLGLGVLTLLAEYGGDGAGSFALLFILALWLLWLLAHFHTTPGASRPAQNTAGGGGSHGGVK